MKQIYISAAAATLFLSAASAQDSTAELEKRAQEEIARTKVYAALTKAQVIGVEGGLMANVKGAPYSAEQITENTQTLGDGTRIHNEISVKLYRDNEGRVRRETPDMISIFDPVAGVGYTLNPKTMTGGKMQVSVSENGGNYVFRSVSGGPEKSMQVFSYSTNGSTSTSSAGGGVATGFGSGVGAGVASGAAGGGGQWVSTSTAEPAKGYAVTYGGGTFIAGPATKAKVQLRATVENLPAKTMEGLNVTGERNTSTIDIGAIGNDRPIDIVDERWYSSDLRLNVMTRHSDPRTGEEMVRLINVSRNNPDASLFQLPAGYEISEGKTLPAVMTKRIPQ
jgi:hypothetical protein